MHGRLGNQMFQYAAARSLQKKTGQNILVSFRQVNNANTEGSNGWENSLKYFNVIPLEEYKGTKSLLYSGMPFISVLVGQVYAVSYRRLMGNFKRWYDYQYRFGKFLDKLGLRWIANGYYNYSNIKKKEYFLNGSFEAEEYFSDIRAELLNEFTPLNPYCEHNRDLYEIIENKNSVCLSIRHFKLAGEQEQLYNVCSLEYYNVAIEEIKKKIENPYFIIFSDDIDWVKEKFDFQEMNFAFETDNNPIWEKIRLMYSCKHFIISNSTFSWWAQYLSRNDNKVVVSPCKWFNNDFESPLINKKWIRISFNGRVVK